MVWLSLTSPAIVPPNHVADEELVAHSVHQSRCFKKGKDGQEDTVRFSAFEPRKDQTDKSKTVRDVSSDRCQYVTESRAAELAWQRAPARGGKFYGWAIISASNARALGTDVVSSPPPDQSNPAHADIMLPVTDTWNALDRNQRLTKLAAAASWLDAPAGYDPFDNFCG